MESKRLDYIDVAKGLGIMAIVFFHTTDMNNLEFFYKWLRSFAVPVFFFVTGYLAAYKGKTDYSIGGIVKKRMHTLILPYCYFSLIIVLFDVLFILMGVSGYGLRQAAKDIVLSCILRGIGTLWFLPVLLIGEILFYGIKPGTRKRETLILIGILSMAAAAIMSFIMSVFDNSSMAADLILSPVIVIGKSLIAVSFIIGGFIFCSLCDWIGKKGKKSTWFITAGLASLLCCCLLSQRNIMTDINHLQIGKPVLYLLCGMTGSAGWLMLLMPLTKQENVITRILTFYGKNSLIVMLTHYSLVMPVIKLFLEFLHMDIFQQPMVLFAGVLLSEIGIIKAINKYVPFMVK